jgi:ribosomal protein S17E
LRAFSFLECDPDKWNQSAGRAIGKTDDIRLLNAYLDAFQQKFEAKRKLIERDAEPTARNIKSIIPGIDIYHEKHMLMEVFANHN